LAKRRQLRDQEKQFVSQLEMREVSKSKSKEKGGVRKLTDRKSGDTAAE
jgi:hypothetical protein